MNSNASKIVVVTGASRGMGQAAAREIAQHGHTVVATMRNPSDFAALQDGEGTFDFERMDVDDPDNVQAALASVEARHGRIDVLINVAGYGLYGAVEDLNEEEIAAQFNTNTLGTWRTCRAVLPGMRARRSGRILNVVTAVRSPFPWMGAYFASKAAVWHLSGALAYEVASFGVEVGIIQPGGYKTDWQTDSLWVTEKSRKGDSPYGAQTQETLEAFRASTDDWPGPDDFGRRVAALVDAPELAFWNIVANEDHQAMLATFAEQTFEEQRVFLRDSIPGYVP